MIAIAMTILAIVLIRYTVTGMGDPVMTRRQIRRRQRANRADPVAENTPLVCHDRTNPEIW